MKRFVASVFSFFMICNVLVVATEVDDSFSLFDEDENVEAVVSSSQRSGVMSPPSSVWNETVAHHYMNLCEIAEKQVVMLTEMIAHPSAVLSSYSLEEVNKVLMCLDELYEKVSEVSSHDPLYEKITTRYAPTILEQARRLRVTRRKFNEKKAAQIKKPSFIKKVALPLGVMMLVGGGSALCDYLRGKAINVERALTLGLLSGTVVGVLIFKDEVIGSLISTVNTTKQIGHYVMTLMINSVSADHQEQEKYSAFHMRKHTDHMS